MSIWPDYEFVRRPRWRLIVAGHVVAAAEDLTVHSNNHYRADEITARIALRGDPTLSAIWDDQEPPILVEAQVGFLPQNAGEDAVPWQTLFVGEIDRIHQSPVQGIVSINGRDLSRRLIDAKTKETFANRTASEIASILAARHGLAADVDPTARLAGAFYQAEHDKVTADSFSKATNEWDLLTFLAKQEGYDLWVRGQTLHFKRSVVADEAHPLDLVYAPSGNEVVSAEPGVAWPSIPVTDIQKERSLTIAKDVKVVMKTWDAKAKRSTEVVYPPGAKKTAQEYVIPPRPGLSPAAALAYVQAQYQDIVLHQRLVDLTMPGELQIDARSIIRLSGTDSSFDHLYYVDTIEREFSVDAGFHQSVRLKNHTTQSETEVG